MRFQTQLSGHWWHGQVDLWPRLWPTHSALKEFHTPFRAFLTRSVVVSIGTSDTGIQASVQTKNSNQVLSKYDQMSQVVWLWNGTKLNRLSCIQVICISYQTYHYTHIYIYKAVSILVKPSRVRPASTNRRSGLSGLSMFDSSFKCWTQEIAYYFICINNVLCMLVNASYRYLPSGQFNIAIENVHV